VLFFCREVVVNVVMRDQRNHADAGLDQTIYLGESTRVGHGNESYSLSSSKQCQWLKDGMAVSENCNYYDFRPDTLGIHTFTLRLTDSDALEATDDVTVYVLDPSFDDTTPPELTLLGNPVVSMIQGAQYLDAGATAFDTHDGNITHSIVVTGASVSSHAVGTYDIIYSVSDQAGNSVSAVRTVNVLPVGTDIIGPAITLNGWNPTTLVQGNTYTDAGAVAVDNVDGPVGYSFDSSVNPAKQGVYQVVYVAEDSVGNRSQETRTVRVTDAQGNIDIQAPAIALVGEASLLVAVGDVYIEKGATATDNVDGDLSAELVIDNPVDSGIVGEFTVRYSVTDAAGNVGYATRQVEVVNPEDIPDAAAPVVSLLNITGGATLTAPQAINATIEDDLLDNWQLSYRATDQSALITLLIHQC